VDERVLNNPQIHRGVVCSAARMPFESSYFDFIFCTWVFEHIEDAKAVADEISRVLKPGGKLLVVAPNKFHYATILKKYLPRRVAIFVNRLRGVSDADTFRNFNRLNTVWALRKYFWQFTILQEIWSEAGVVRGYMQHSLFTLIPGILYERLVCSTERLARLRHHFFITLQKRGNDTAEIH
jgi:SAM-dependent methyltransferase